MVLHEEQRKLKNPLTVLCLLASVNLDLIFKRSKDTFSPESGMILPNPKISPGEGNGTPLQDSRLENPMDGGAWWAVVHGVAKSQTELSDFTFTFHFHALEEEMATHSSVLAWRIPGTGSLVGCRLWGHTESDTTEAT